MVEETIDITGKICPFCLLIVKKKLAKMAVADVLSVICDHPPAATDTIPYAMKKAGHTVEIKRIEPGVWELKITKY
ncbi:MAG: sulfurtransferase TusA family protein [Promethearchaeota archaeon]